MYVWYGNYEQHIKYRLETKHEDLRDFKNRGEAEVFKHEDPSARSLSYLENGGVFIVICKGITCGLYYCRCNNVADN